MSDKMMINAELKRLMESDDAQAATQYIETLLVAYQTELETVEDDIDDLQRKREGILETMRHLRTVLMIHSDKETEELVRSFASMRLWEAIREVLRQERRWMSANEIVAAVEKTGKAVGNYAHASIITSMSRKADIFCHKGKRGRYLYGLKEWPTREETEEVLRDLRKE